MLEPLFEGVEFAVHVGFFDGGGVGDLLGVDGRAHAELFFEFAEFFFGGEVHGLVFHGHDLALEAAGEHFIAGRGFGFLVLDAVFGGGKGTFVLIFESESFERLGDAVLNLGLFPAGLEGEGLGSFASDFFFLPLDGDLDGLDGLDGAFVRGLELLDGGVHVRFFAEELAGEVAVALLEGHGRLAFHLGGFGLGFLQHLFQAVLLGDGLDGFFAVGDERALHIPTSLIEHHVGIFNLVHCAIEERFEPGKESFHSVGGVSGES